MAAVELLVGHRCWLRRADFVGRFVAVEPAPAPGEVFAELDWEGAVAALDGGDLPCSGGEGRVLRVAASLAAGVPVELGAALGGLDAASAALVAQAVLAAAGARRCAAVDDPPYPPGVRVVGAGGAVAGAAGPGRGEHR
jgi:hypothetical protein